MHIMQMHVKTHTQLFNSLCPMSWTTQLSRYQKKPSPTHRRERRIRTNKVYCAGAHPLYGALSKLGLSRQLSQPTTKSQPTTLNNHGSVCRQS